LDEINTIETFFRNWRTFIKYTTIIIALQCFGKMNIIIIIAGARNKTINFIGIGSCLKPDSVRTKIVRKKIKPYAFLHLRSWSGDNEVFRAIKIRLIVSLNAKIKQQKQEHYGCEFKPGEVALFFQHFGIDFGLQFYYALHIEQHSSIHQTRDRPRRQWRTLAEKLRTVLELVSYINYICWTNHIIIKISSSIYIE